MDLRMWPRVDIKLIDPQREIPHNHCKKNASCDDGRAPRVSRRERY